MSDHYDVIIIGTGAGGGTLAHRLAPVRQADPAARARRLPAARARELGLARGLRQGALPLRRARGTTRTAQPFTPHAAVLRRRQHEVLRGDPLPPARARLRRGPPLRRHLARLADLLRRPRAVLRRGRAALPRARAGAARTRPSRRAPGPFPYPAVSHEPRIQQLHDDFERTGHQPVPPAGRRRPRRVRPRGAGAACAATASTASRASTDGKADAHVLLRAPGARAPQRHAAHAREGRAAGDRRLRAHA